MGLRAVIIRCPNCNANLEIASTVSSVTCSYCGTLSRIQANKTQMFQLPKAWPPANVQSPQERMQQLQQLRQLMPVRRFSIVLALLPMLIITSVVIGGIYFAKRGIGGLIGSKMMWAGHNPVLIDVDGDGVPDPIGIVRYVIDNDRAHLAAFSGKTGAPLWESETLGKYGELGQLQFATAGSLVLIASDKGMVIARDAKAQGAMKWQVALSEKVDAICKGAENEVVIETADKKWFAIDAKGAKRETKPLIRLDRDYTNDEARATFEHVGGEAGEVCISAGGNAWRQPPYVIALQHWHDLANIEGMKADLLVKRPGGPVIALGSKHPGTSVPMLARLAPIQPPEEPTDLKKRRKRSEEKAELPGALWKTEIPTVDPLVSRFDVVHTALTDKAVIVVYQGANSTYRLTAFELESGKRMWDRQLHAGSGFVVVGLVVTGDVVMLTTWQNLTAFAIADGSDRFEVGSSN